MLTHRQREIYEFIRESIRNGPAPSVREIMVKFGIRSPNGVHCHLKALKKKNLIDWDSHKARTIRLVNGESRDLMGALTNWRQALADVSEAHDQSDFDAFKLAEKELAEAVDQM